jgi:ATP-dependent Lon protease
VTATDESVRSDELDGLLNTHYAGRVVRKDLLHQIEGGENVPSYVLEYLLGRYCASDDPEEIRLGIEAVKSTLRENYFRHDEANKAQSLVEQRGKHRFIDRIEVRFVPNLNKYWAAMDNFSFNRIHVNERFYRQYERLLEGGIWAIVDVEYWPEGADAPKELASPFRIAEVRPIQLARFEFDEFCEGRRQFSTDQWIDALLRSAGLEPNRMDRRLKFPLTARFLPFVEKNFNFIELGPRGTGKSYVFSEMSPYGILLSGGKASSANLFYNNARRQVGLVGHWDVVAFDEVGGMKVSEADTFQIMKDYMANGRFSRGVVQVMADASFAFVGNLNQSVETLVQSAGMDLFQPLPKEFDLAVMDRFHFYLPGWEIPKTSKDILTTHFGFVTDYLAEAFRLLRKENRFDAVDQQFRFGSHVEGRDAIAVRKSVSGFLKLLHPHGDFTSDELREYLELSLEARRRVKEQLKKRGSFEFYKTSFSYFSADGDATEHIVSVPEQGGSGLISPDPLPPGTIYTAAMDDQAHLSLYRLEVTLTAGTGKLRTPAGLERGLKESLNRAWSYLRSVDDRMGLAPLLTQRDLVAEAIDLSGGRVEAACGVAFFAAMVSAITQRRIQAGTVVLGDITIQGNIKPLPSITEVLQMVVENGALRVLLPTGNKLQVASLSEDVVEKLDLVFYSDVDRAIARVVEM